MKGTRPWLTHLFISKLGTGWHVWISGGDIPSRWLSAHHSQREAFIWAERYAAECGRGVAR